MSEFVKKTIVGYKDVPGGSSDPDCTHVILTLNEYKKIVRERDEAIRTVGIERQNADRQMNEEKKNAAYQIRQVRDQAVKEIAEMQGALAQAQKDAAYQRHLNENLLRISRERANADRKLKPKKGHTGYCVVLSVEKEHRYGTGKYMRRVLLWETVIQSPYGVDLPEELVRKQVTEELTCEGATENSLIHRIGIDEFYPGSYAAMMKNRNKRPWYEIPEETDEPEEHKEENIMLLPQFRANFKTGYWEAVFSHTRPLGVVPWDMRG